jgi:hypothetical protein
MATITNSRRLAAILVLAVLLPATVIAACSNDNSNPVPPVYNVGDSAPPPTADSGQGSDAGQSGDSGQGPTPDATPSTDGPAPIPDAQPTQKDGAPVTDASVCTTDAGCWACTPITPPEFLNQCTGSQCSPFDNYQRLPSYDGGLPPLN